MASGHAEMLGDLPEPVAGLLQSARRAVMSTLGPDGAAHSVPVVFAAVGEEIVSPIDHKPKTGQILARVRNLERDPRVTLLIDEWDEEWTRLVWLMVRGTAAVDPGAPAQAMRALNARYPQYDLEQRHDALVVIRPTRLTWWSWS